MDDWPELTIGETAKRAGVATSSIRYYESIGLLPQPDRLHGQRRPTEFGEARYQFIQPDARLLGSARRFTRHGQSGIEISDLFPNVARCAAHVRRLLAPGGALVLLEVLGRQGWLDLTFGLLEGWWKFADLDLRPQYPLLSPEAWADLLAREGYAECTCFPTAERDLPDPDQVVLLARADARWRR